MGRPNKPSALKALEGNRGKRARNRQEPDPRYLDDFTPPAHLSEAAKAVWSEMAPKMREAKVLTVIDVDPFGRWCTLTARWRKVQQDLGEQGVMVERADKDGESKAAPAVINQLAFYESMIMKQLLAIEREFGMTPAARTRVQVEPQLPLFPSAPNDGAGANDKQPQQPAGSRFFTGGAAPH